MKYFSKIFVTLFILTFACFGFCNIVRADNTVPAETTGTTQSQPSGQISTTIKDTSSEENEILYVPNIINILLIAVGIVLILLAIAIYTRLKR
ncbi:MAG: hypothetical protein IJH12_00240 [Clostridia bacterium]|nr:hypothetical protein [Clostridia bacterium]